MNKSIKANVRVQFWPPISTWVGRCLQCKHPIVGVCWIHVYTLRTLIFARHLFSRVHIFAAYIFASEALGINFRYVSIFAWWLFSIFLQKINWK